MIKNHKVKKLTAIMLCVIFIAALVLFTGCGENYEGISAQGNTFQTIEYEAVLNDFLDSCPERTYFSKEEKSAAVYLKNKLESYGITTRQQDFDHRYAYSAGLFSGENDIVHHFKSQNIIGRIDSARAGVSGKIVIGAGYDNMYHYTSLHQGYYHEENSIYSFADTSLKAEGALNATGAAAALMLAKSLKEINDLVGLPFNVEIVFFGAESYGSIGSLKYTESSSAMSDVQLFINLARIGGANIYTYFDEVNTPHGENILSAGRRLGYGDYIKEAGALAPTINVSTTNGKLPYTNFSLLGASGRFFGSSKKVCNITTGDWESVLLSDRESLAYENLSLTSSDKRENLARLCPQYSKQAVMIADTLVEAMTSDGFAAAVLSSPPDYAWLTFPLAGFLAAIILSLVAFLAIVLVSRYYSKKYPYSSPVKPKAKVAVFGMDYEKPEDADIFIDVKPVGNKAGKENRPTIDPFDFNAPDENDKNKPE